jgi:hypothetical protein
MQDQSIKIEQDLQQIADMLLLNGTLTECPGLVHGKMGIAVFFFRYAQYIDNELFADYAMDVIDEVLNQIHVNSLPDYEKGIAGIGVGFDYLIRNDFLDVEEDICEDCDDKVYRAVMYDPWQDFSQYNGLTGYGQYWMTRLHYQTPAIQARECLWHIVKCIEERFVAIEANEQTDVCFFLRDLQEIPDFTGCNELLEQCQKQWDLQNEIDSTLRQISDLDMEKAPSATGLLNGYAGEAMLRLTALNQTDNSWMKLL